MARNVYFSFHYQDVIDFRANVVRMSYKFRKKGVVFRDSSIWEEAQEKGVKKIKGLINAELKGSGVTCVLIGDETYSRRWVRYEIVKSFVDRKGQVGVGINWIKGKNGKKKFWPGGNPFDYLKLQVSRDGTTIYFFELDEDKWVKYKDLPSTPNKNHVSERYFGRQRSFSKLYETYSYDWDNGKKELVNWIETAATDAGR